MKLFVSWSGTTSHRVAKTLGKWLPFIIQSIKPFVSDQDIEKGARWEPVLLQELREAKFGIVCITACNKHAPWLYFESGALSKSIEQASLVPVLFRVDHTEITGPLEQFQSISCDHDGLLGLVHSINNHPGIENRMEPYRLTATFEQWWPKIQPELENIPNNLEECSQTGYSWLYTHNELARIELDADCKSIWIVTPSPEQDLLLPCIKQIVQQNIGRGVDYTFIVSRPDDLDSTKSVFQRLFLDHESQLRLFVVDRDSFQRLAVTHYIALNVEQDPRVLLELPTEKSNFWIEVSNKAVDGFISRIRHMREKADEILFEHPGASIPILTEPNLRALPPDSRLA